MADNKITGLPVLAIPESPDVILVIDDTNGTPTSKQMTLKEFFGNVNSNTVFNGANSVFHAANNQFTGEVTISGILTSNVQAVKITTSTPSSNNATAEGMKVGHVRFTNTHMYVAVSNATIRRISLTVF